jgi:DeoR/GlpR family transcriptional regulator of sugar metabolism
MTDPATQYVHAQERRARIVAQLETMGFLSVTELSRDLRVSAMTIRRDLHLLESNGDVRLVHGGASLARGALAGGTSQRDAMAEARCRVATLAVELVKPDHTIAIDAGLTALALARVLPESFRGAVITHSVPVVQLFAANPMKARLVALGGELRFDRHAFVGPSTEAALAGLRAKTAFIEPAALDERGMYAGTPAEASVQRRLMEIADEVTVIATSAALSNSAPARIAPLDRATRLVIDEPVPEELGLVLERAGVSIHPCRPKTPPATTRLPLAPGVRDCDLAGR